MSHNEAAAAALTAPQARALKALKANTWKTAAELGVFGSTMAVLVEAGWAESLHSVARNYGWDKSPRQYKITGRGILVRRYLPTD